MTHPEDELGRALDASAPRADQATFDAIVRRHRGRQQRRMKQVTTVSVVVAVAAVGVSASGAFRQSNGIHRGVPVNALRAAPTRDGGELKALGRAPKGLRWAVPGHAVIRRTFAALAPAPSGSAAVAATTTTLPVAGASNGPLIAICTSQGCGSSGEGTLAALFQRTGGGVELRAFTESESPIVFEPQTTVLAPTDVSASTTTSSAPTSTEPSSGSVTTTSSPPPPATTVPSSVTSTTPSAPVPPPLETTVPPTTSTTSTSPTSDTTTPTTTPANGSGSGSAGSGGVAAGPVVVAPDEPVTSCATDTALEVEASDAGAVGEVVVPLGAASTSGTALDLVEASVLGSREDSPMIVVVAHVQSTVSTVTATFADGTTDEMTPDQGWIVLGDAVPSSTSLSSTGESVGLTASDASGNVLETTTIPSEPAFAVPDSCVEPIAPLRFPAARVVAGGAVSGTGPVDQTTVAGNGGG